jgi:glyoxylase-like metal-dependent hydrolase (beta-lactamase superfamily II)
VHVADLVVRVTAPNPSVMTGPGTNTYLVGRGELAVVDPGPSIDAHLDAIEAAAAPLGEIRWIAVTHHHPDHAPAATGLSRRTGAPVIAHGHPEVDAPDRAVGEGYVLTTSRFALRALHTPGHASDHLCWLLEGPSLLFSGDHVMQGSTVVIRPPDGDMAQYLASLERLAAERPPLRTVAPGHGRLIGDPAGVIRGIVEHRLEREQLVETVVRAWPSSTVEELLPTVYPDLAEALVPWARQSLLAHLQKLSAEGRIGATLGPSTGPLDKCEATRWRPAGDGAA